MGDLSSYHLKFTLTAADGEKECITIKPVAGRNPLDFKSGKVVIYFKVWEGRDRAKCAFPYLDAGHEFPIYADVPVDLVECRVSVPAGTMLLMEPVQIFEKRKKRGSKVCMNCRLWDRKAGQERLTHKSHLYGNGSFSQTEEIVRAVAAKSKLPPLTPETVGYCPVHLGGKLCHEGSPACKEHYTAYPWIVRWRNWWRRNFR